jgi:hypothetical protein
MLTQNAMVQTPMLSTMTFKIAEVNIVKEVEPNMIGLSNHKKNSPTGYFLNPCKKVEKR